MSGAALDYKDNKDRQDSHNTSVRQGGKPNEGARGETIEYAAVAPKVVRRPHHRSCLAATAPFQKQPIKRQ